MDNYDDILNRSWDELPEDKLLPDGWFILRARNAAFVEPKGEANAKVLFFFNVQEPLYDGADAPDPAELEALGPDYDYTQNEVVYTAWVERNRDWQSVKRLISMLGVKADGSKLDTLKNVKGTQIAGKLVTRTFEDKMKVTQERNEVAEFAAID